MHFPYYMSEKESGASSFMLTKLEALPFSPSLADITSVRYAVGTDRQKHKSAPMAWTTKQNLVRSVMRRRSVLATRLHLKQRT